MRHVGNETLAALTAYKSGFFNIGLFSAVINLLMLDPALYMLQVYDRVLASGNEMTLLMLTLMILGPTIWVQILHHDKPIYPYEYPALFSMAIAFVGIWFFSITDKSAAKKPIDDDEDLDADIEGEIDDLQDIDADDDIENAEDES